MYNLMLVRYVILFCRRRKESKKRIQIDPVHFHSMQLHQKQAKLQVVFICNDFISYFLVKLPLNNSAPCCYNGKSLTPGLAWETHICRVLDETIPFAGTKILNEELMFILR